jgi:hypothetical protein
MPEATFLHIQTRETNQPRVMELSGSSVRVGRGAQCEVRLVESALADVQCLLRRRGPRWHIQPVGPPGRLSIDGRPVDQQRPLPLGTPVRVGSHWLTLRQGGAVSTGFGSYDAPIPIEPRAVYEVPVSAHKGSSLGEHEYTPPTPPASGVFGSSEKVEGDAERLQRWKARLEQRERWLKARQEERRWGARWKAFGESLRGRAAESADPGEPAADPTERPSTLSTPTEAASPRSERGTQSPEPSSSPLPPASGGSAAPLSDLQPSPKNDGQQNPAVTDPMSVGLGDTPEIDTLLAQQLAASADASDHHAQPTSGGSPPPLANVQPPHDNKEAGQDSPVLASEVETRVEHGAEQADETSSAASHFVRPGRTRSAPPQAVDQPSRHKERGQDSPANERKQSSPSHEGVEDSLGRIAPRGIENLDEHATAESAATGFTESMVAPAPQPLTEPEGAVAPETLPVEDPHPYDWPRASSFVAHTSEGLVGRWRHEAPLVPEDHPYQKAYPVADEPIHESEWPSARSILAAHAARGAQPAAPKSKRAKPPAPASNDAKRPATKRGPTRRPEPTVSQAPAQWTLPGWLALFPTAAAVMIAGSFALKLSWTWSRDDYAAGLVADRLLRAEPIPQGSFELPDAPEPTWWSSTPEHLHLRALAVSRGEKDATQGERVRFLLSTAKNAAPLDSSVRLALAESDDRDGRSAGNRTVVGLSRDIVALRKTGRSLLANGKTDAAIRVDREALELGARVDIARAPLPAFLEDPKVRRFRLPHEEALEGIVRDLMAHPGWRWADWSQAIPSNGLAPLVAYRLLWEAGDPDADAAFAMVMASHPDASDPALAAQVLAAQGEALALSERWSDAAEKYRAAIDIMPSDLIRRTWWINVGEIAGRLRDTELMRKAWAAARGPSPKDEINTRMVEGRGRYGLDVRAKPTAKAASASESRQP